MKNQNPKRKVSAVAIRASELVQIYKTAGKTDKAESLKSRFAPGVTVFTSAENLKKLKGGKSAKNVQGQPGTGVDSKSDTGKGS